MMENINRVKCAPYWAEISIAGCPVMARNYIREFCLTGLCVSIRDADFVYTGGMEGGVVIGLLNYARFQCSEDELQSKAEDLAEFLIVKLHQSSATVLSPLGSLWMTRRGMEAEFVGTA